MPRQLEAAERLAVDQRAGDLAVDVQVADAELAASRVAMFSGLREKRPPVSAYCVPLAISSACVQVARLDHRQHRAEDLFLGDASRSAARRRRCAGRRSSPRSASAPTSPA